MTQEQREKRAETHKRWARITKLTTGGIIYGGLHKRPRPADVCELCGKRIERLHYHHWDDRDMSKGIWVCSLCHMFCESIDNEGKELIKVYEDLKIQVENAFKEKEEER